MLRPLSPGHIVSLAAAAWTIVRNSRRSVASASPGSPVRVELLFLAYQKWGANCGTHLAGQSSFCAVEHVSGEVTACVDHLGTVPLLDTCREGVHLFATQMASMLAHPLMHNAVPDVNATALLVAGRIPRRVTSGLGSKTFTTQAGLAYVAGARVRAFFTGAPTTYVEGTVASYSGTTLILNADDFNGSTTPTSWTFTIAGKTGTRAHRVHRERRVCRVFKVPRVRPVQQARLSRRVPRGPTGATGPGGSSGAAILKDANGVTLGTVLSASSTGVISFRTSTGYIVSANIDGTIPNAQFYWTSSDCSGRDPVLLNGGGVGVKRYDKFVAYSQKTNQLYMITNTNTNHIALTQPLVHGALENTSSTNPALYTCGANTNNATANGFTIQRITPTALGIPTASGAPLTVPAPLSFSINPDMKYEEGQAKAWPSCFHNGPSKFVLRAFKRQLYGGACCYQDRLITGAHSYRRRRGKIN